MTNGDPVACITEGTYLVKVSDKIGPYLEEINALTTVALHGAAAKYHDLIVDYFQKTKQDNVGILLEGTSGCGKSQTIKNIAATLKIPMLVVDSGLDVESVRTILGNIGSDCILYIDEFEKKYGAEREHNEAFLSLFDGVETPHRVLFALAINERRSLSSYFFNRPGRILFNFKYNALSTQEALDYICTQVSVTDTDALFKYLDRVAQLSYDICNAIINIITLYPNDFGQVIGHLNVNETEYGYKVVASYNGKVVKTTEEDYLPRVCFYVYPDPQSTHGIQFDFDNFFGNDRKILESTGGRLNHDQVQKACDLENETLKELFPDFDLRLMQIEVLKVKKVYKYFNSLTF